MKSVNAGETISLHLPTLLLFVCFCSVSLLSSHPLFSLFPALSLALFLSVTLPYHHPATFPAKSFLLLWRHGDSSYVVA